MATLNDPIETHFRLTPTQKRALKRLSLTTLRDLLYHFPTRYEHTSLIKPVSALRLKESVIVYGKIRNLKTRKAFKRKTPIAEGMLSDSTGQIKLIWFHQPYIAKMVPENALVKVTGTVTGKVGSMYIANPEVEQTNEIPAILNSLFSGEERHTPSLYPVYRESRGITSKWFYHHITRIFKEVDLDELSDPIPPHIRKKYSLPSLSTAFVWMHTPRRTEDGISARKRFAFEEVFLIQLGKLRVRHTYQEHPSFSISVAPHTLSQFIERFPFAMTKAQHRAIDTIVSDLKKRHAMSRLLEGDVGSGKTAVAAATAYAVVQTHPEGQNFGNLQVAYMAPTEILAKQQFKSFIENFSHLPINIGLITSSGCEKFPSKVSPGKATPISRTQLLKWVKNGEIPILVGTHALIQKAVQFENLAYVIIDEQHRFGTIQRQTLIRKDNIAPHLLSMTATPIPRTLALTIYGDLDLTLLDEMPPGRKEIKTEIVPPQGREAVYEKVRAELKDGRQVYVICPRIDEPDPDKELALNAKSVTEECARLKKDVFPEYVLDILHSKLKRDEKEKVMQQFINKETDILVATSVVEVGVNVPNATTIIIEGAERFGLAQLHQLRGRVLRSNHQAYCYVFADSRGKKTLDRLRALKTARNGFELAEEDLKIRGSGELYGRRQAGLSDVAMEALKNIKMVEAARREAQIIIESNPDLSKHPDLQKLVDQKLERLHFE
jgi:ATP-dependent DNA helicase RecG